MAGSDGPEKATLPSGGLIFPPWFDELMRLLGAGGAFAGVYVVFLFWYGASPKTMAVGYMPKQPVPYSHALHAGELGIDCRYCHTGVEIASHASIPPTQTCMNCHTAIRPESTKLEPIRQSNRTGMPVDWIRVHDLPDYVYFNHSAHVMRGVSCVECHGRIDRMEEVYQDQPLSMGWCLDCHRNPVARLRKPEYVTDLGWGQELTTEEREDIGRGIMRDLKLLDEQGNHTWRMRQLTSCSTCHR